jgi:D-glycero-D-manno-heptose 1,7-bisphosphate phosphatase
VSKHILLDRDGVINRRILNGYVTSWQQFEFLPQVLDALRLLTESGYRVIVVSNQAGVGKGLMSSETLADITAHFVEEVERNGGRVERVYYCPHRDHDGCECRKPKPGLLLQAQREHLFAFADTFLVGDSQRDLMAARHVGCPAILVGGGEVNVDAKEWPSEPEAILPDLYAAARFILARKRPGRKYPLQETPSAPLPFPNSTS